eukprot:6544192-Prymnesium_polylepis.2
MMTTTPDAFRSRSKTGAIRSSVRHGARSCLRRGGKATNKLSATDEEGSALERAVLGAHWREDEQFGIIGQWLALALNLIEDLDSREARLEDLRRVLTAATRRELRRLQNLQRVPRLREAGLQAVLEATDATEVGGCVHRPLSWVQCAQPARGLLDLLVAERCWCLRLGRSAAPYLGRLPLVVEAGTRCPATRPADDELRRIARDGILASVAVAANNDLVRRTPPLAEITSDGRR